MDGVEIVMEVEDPFDVTIADAEAAKMLTPRDIIDHVMRKVGRTDHAQCLTQRAFHRIRASLMRNRGLKRAEIRPDVSTRELFPVSQRKELLRKTLGDVGLATTPELVRPKWLVGTQFIVSCSLGVAGLSWAASDVHYSSFIPNFLAACPFFTGLLVAVLCGWLSAILTSGARYDFKPALANVGGLSRWVVAHGTEMLGAPPGPWSRERVAERVREICVDVLGCEKTYREDANFVKDLGLS